MQAPFIRYNTQQSQSGFDGASMDQGTWQQPNMVSSEQHDNAYYTGITSSTAPQTYYTSQTNMTAYSTGISQPTHQTATGMVGSTDGNNRGGKTSTAVARGGKTVNQYQTTGAQQQYDNRTNMGAQQAMGNAQYQNNGMGNMNNSMGNVNNSVGNVNNSRGNMNTSMGNVNNSMGNMNSNMGNMNNNMGNMGNTNSGINMAYYGYGNEQQMSGPGDSNEMMSAGSYQTMSMDAAGYSMGTEANMSMGMTGSTQDAMGYMGGEGGMTEVASYTSTQMGAGGEWAAGMDNSSARMGSNDNNYNYGPTKSHFGGRQPYNRGGANLRAFRSRGSFPNSHRGPYSRGAGPHHHRGSANGEDFRGGRRGFGGYGHFGNRGRGNRYSEGSTDYTMDRGSRSRNAIYLDESNFNHWCFLRKNFNKEDDKLAKCLFELHSKFCGDSNETNKSKKPAISKRKYSDGPNEEEPEEELTEEEREMKKLMGFSGFKSSKGARENNESFAATPDAGSHEPEKAGGRDKVEPSETSSLTPDERRAMAALGGFSVFTRSDEAISSNVGFGAPAVQFSITSDFGLSSADESQGQQ